MSKGRRGERAKGPSAAREKKRGATSATSGSGPPPLRPIAPTDRATNRVFFVFAGVTVVLLVVRWVAARSIGFGDSEALYACYAIHPQAAYLDHPGLVGIFARALGNGNAPSATDAHTITAVLATVVPWMITLVARTIGAERKHALAAGLAFAVVPEIAIGLFGMTPDLLLVYLALGAIGLAAAGFEEKAGTSRSTVLIALAGLAAGIGAGAKASGALVWLGIAFAFFRSKHAEKSKWPWIGILAGALVLAPIGQFESAHGWPMLRHRLGGLGLSLKGFGALTAAQLAYVSPILVLIAIVLAIDLWRKRNDDAIAQLLFACVFVPLVPLGLLCVVHGGAEPHWIAPALLPLPLWAARRASDPDRPRLLDVRWVGSGIALAAVLVGLVHAWTLWPQAPKLAPSSYDPKVDITNELYGWKDAIRAIEAQDATAPDTVIVGPHWTICAQVHAAIPEARVGCEGESDFATWFPRHTWRSADRIVYVSDDRFPDDPTKTFAEYNIGSLQHVTTLRGGRVVRTFTISLLERQAHAHVRRTPLPSPDPRVDRDGALPTPSIGPHSAAL